MNKTSASKECELCHYWFFKDVGFKFEEHVCNGSHDLLTMAYSLKNIAILSAKGATFRCFLMDINKNLSDNLNIITKALSILLVTKKVELLNYYALFYIKWVGI